MMATLELVADQIILPDAPDIPGLTFRKFRGESDYPKMAKAIAAAKESDRIERTTTAENIAWHYAHLVNSDPWRDMLFAEVDGEVIGYNRVEWRRETEGNWIYAHLGFLTPEWRGRGIGRAMLRAAERRLFEIATEHAKAGEWTSGAQRFFDASAADTEKGAEGLLLSEGYSPVRHGYNMVRPLGEEVIVSPLPDGLEVRPVKPEHRRAIWEADQEAFRDHWGYVPGEEKDYQRWLSDPIQNPDLYQVGWDGDQVAGMVLNFVNQAENEEYNRKRGYTEGISVRRPWRKRGLARALLTRSLQTFKDMGMTEAALGVDTENRTGALRLYESVGFRVVKRFSSYRKPLDGGAQI